VLLVDGLILVLDCCCDLATVAMIGMDCVVELMCC
jgi:hypothetical protein